MSEVFLTPVISSEYIEQMPPYNPRLRSIYDYEFERSQPQLYQAMNVRLTPRLRVSAIDRQPILNIYSFAYVAVSRAVMAATGLLSEVKSIPEVTLGVYKEQIGRVNKITPNEVSPGAIFRHQEPLFRYMIRSAQAVPLPKEAFAHCQLASRALLYSLEAQLWSELDRQLFQDPI